MLATAIKWIAGLVGSGLLAVALTFLLWPLWSWIEAFTGVESLGHSGPAAWCFVLMWVLVAGLVALMARRRSR